jgi:hypothetical protein
MNSQRDPNAVQVALDAIDAAFGDTPRPDNEALLHERCFDDNDIVRLYELEHWRDMSDDLVESEYAALSFLSPEGFRHFIAAYMRFALRHPDSGAAAVDSTVWGLWPFVYEDAEIREFAASKLTLFTDDQRAAVIAFLDAMSGLHHEDAAKALRYWRG